MQRCNVLRTRFQESLRKESCKYSSIYRPPTLTKGYWFPKTRQIVERLGTSNTHCLPISLATIHLLSSLLDRGQHGIIGNSRLGGHERSLGFEVDVEGLDACVVI